MDLFKVKIRFQRARLCLTPWKGAKHRVFMRQISPLSPPWADWLVIGGHKRLIRLIMKLALMRQMQESVKDI